MRIEMRNEVSARYLILRWNNGTSVSANDQRRALFPDNSLYGSLGGSTNRFDAEEVRYMPASLLALRHVSP